MAWPLTTRSSIDEGASDLPSTATATVGACAAATGTFRGSRSNNAFLERTDDATEEGIGGGGGGAVLARRQRCYPGARRIHTRRVHSR